MLEKAIINLHKIIIFMRQVLIYPGEDGFWVAECPSLKGCISQGESKEEAIKNIKEAIGLFIKVLADDNIKIPEDNFDSMLIAV